MVWCVLKWLCSNECFFISFFHLFVTTSSDTSDDQWIRRTSCKDNKFIWYKHNTSNSNNIGWIQKEHGPNKRRKGEQSRSAIASTIRRGKYHWRNEICLWCTNTVEEKLVFLCSLFQISLSVAELTPTEMRLRNTSPVLLILVGAAIAVCLVQYKKRQVCTLLNCPFSHKTACASGWTGEPAMTCCLCDCNSGTWGPLLALTGDF